VNVHLESISVDHIDHAISINIRKLEL
jgi:hypothetical protein